MLKTEPSKKDKYQSLSSWISIGVTIGFGLGLAFDKLAIGIAIGLALGAVIGSARKAKQPDAPLPGCPS